MILTDGVNANYSDIVMKHNHFFDGEIIPVRIFTYLIGQEVTNVEEIKWISCTNRGVYHLLAMSAYEMDDFRFLHSCSKLGTSHSLCVAIYLRNS